MADVSLLAPIHIHEIDKRMRSGLEDLSRRVTAQAAVEGRGADLILRVYIAGLYHGASLAPRRDNPKPEVRSYEC